MDREQVAAIFVEIATLLELKGENPFKVRAYTNAARALTQVSEPLKKVVGEGRLGEIPGLGEALRSKVTELVTTGKLEYYEKLRASTPPGLLLLMDIPGLGPKKVKALHEKLGIETIEHLEQACRENKVAGLQGFGDKTQANICAGIERRRSYASKHLLWEAISPAQEMLGRLRDCPEVVRCSCAGSLRRYRETVGDVDLLASSKVPELVLDFFVSQPEVTQVLGKGETKASVLWEGGLQADLRVVSDGEFAAALMYFTGSKEHNIVMRQRAIARGLRLNEYGLFRSQQETRDPRLLVECLTEEEIFRELGLNYIPPEMREDCGEFASAERSPIPRLLEWTDLRGSLHNHSTWSDGRQGLEQIASSMRDLGLTYWGVTDHSKASIQANGLTAERLAEQLKEIAEINRRLAEEGAEFRLLSGVEVDILKDGQLDLDDEVVSKLDVVIASIHQGFGADTDNTERLIAAAQNPYVHILGHLTGRLLLDREPYKVDHHAVIDACASTGTWIELNSAPRRLDMDWRFWGYAKSKGVKCVINCDAHGFEQTAYLRLGAGFARKAGLTREDVINTMPLSKLKTALRLKRKRG